MNSFERFIDMLRRAESVLIGTRRGNQSVIKIVIGTRGGNKTIWTRPDS